MLQEIPLKILEEDSYLGNLNVHAEWGRGGGGGGLKGIELPFNHVTIISVHLREDARLSLCPPNLGRGFYIQRRSPKKEHQKEALRAAFLTLHWHSEGLEEIFQCSSGIPGPLDPLSLRGRTDMPKMNVLLLPDYSQCVLIPLGLKKDSLSSARWGWLLNPVSVFSWNLEGHFSLFQK